MASWGCFPVLPRASLSHSMSLLFSCFSQLFAARNSVLILAPGQPDSLFIRWINLVLGTGPSSRNVTISEFTPEPWTRWERLTTCRWEPRQGRTFSQVKLLHQVGSPVLLKVCKISGEIEGRGRARQCQLPFSSWLTCVIIYPTQIIPGERKSVKVKTQLQGRQIQASTISSPASLSPTQDTSAAGVLCPRARSWRLLASVTLKKKPLRQTNTSTDICN